MMIIIIIIIIIIGAGTAQPVQRLSCDLDDQRLQSRQGAIYFSLLQKVHTLSGPHRASYSVGTEVSFFSWVKRSEREVNRSSTLTAGVKHEWRYTCIPPMWLHGVDRENFTFTLTFYFYFYRDCSPGPVTLRGNSNSRVLPPTNVLFF